MACISKLASGFAYDCDTGATGLQSAIIINKEDIESFTVDTTNGVLYLSAITFISSAKTYKIDTPKRVLVVSESLKVNEGAPNMYSHSVTLTDTGTTNSPFLARVQAIPNGTFVLLTKDVTGKIRVYGLYYGLSATGVDRSSADNGGWTTITLETPEQVIGEDFLDTTSTIYNTIYADAVY